MDGFCPPPPCRSGRNSRPPVRYRRSVSPFTRWTGNSPDRTPISRLLIRRQRAKRDPSSRSDAANKTDKSVGIDVASNCKFYCTPDRRRRAAVCVPAGRAPRIGFQAGALCIVRRTILGTVVTKSERRVRGFPGKVSRFVVRGAIPGSDNERPAPLRTF